MMQRRLANVERLFGPEHPETAECLTYLGALLYDLGRMAEAEPCFRRAHAIQTALLGAADPCTRESLASLAGVLLELGDFAGAEPLLWRYLVMLEKEKGRGHPKVATVLFCLSECLRSRGQLDQAVAMLERELTIIRAHEGDDAEDAVFTAERIEALRRERDEALLLAEGEECDGAGAAGGAAC